MAKGYNQKTRIDYKETFSPVAMLKSIRILLSIAAHYDYEIWQMDVKTASLNIREEIFMDQPKGFISHGQESKVCKLMRSIYGLKQASHSWNIHLMRQSNRLVSHKIWMNLVFTKRLVGALLHF